jgi:hypothetical protein
LLKKIENSEDNFYIYNKKKNNYKKMTKNILSLNDFKGKKTPESVNEMVELLDDFYRVSVDVDLPKSLISSYIKKVKDTAGKDLRAEMGEKRLAERLVQWANENYLNIDNLPLEIVMGSEKAPLQAQGQVQSQVQTQPEPEEDGAQAQTQVQPAQVQPAQTQAQPVQNTQAQKPAVQVQGQQRAQATAAQVPAQEI